MNRKPPGIVVIAFLISGILAPIGVVAAWTGSEAAGWIRDASVLTSTATAITLWLLMRRERARQARGD